MSWSLADIPAQTGRTALVTGVSTGGLGHFTALELARAGARVVVDLADLSSVRSAAAEAATYDSIDLLVNNAGIMATPYRRTVDGF